MTTVAVWLRAETLSSAGAWMTCRSNSLPVKTATIAKTPTMLSVSRAPARLVLVIDLCPSASTGDGRSPSSDDAMMPLPPVPRRSGSPVFETGAFAPPCPVPVELMRGTFVRSELGTLSVAPLAGGADGAPPAGAADPRTVPSESRRKPACEEPTMPSAVAFASRFWLEPSVSSCSLSDDVVRPRSRWPTAGR